ncbi:MAG: guanylate kinase [Bryobacterales bacterium]|nr:guanylate kinase [Bryobacterales bacterium]
MVVIISAPSGSGKSTLVNGLIAQVPDIRFSVSYTTRAPRGVEREGQNYHYTSRDDFERRIAGDEFLEHAEVFGNYYGTHREYATMAANAGCDLLLDIDVQGAMQVMEKVPDAVSVFILAPSREVLEQRLRKRSEDSEETIQRRLREASQEVRFAAKYTYVVINDDVAESVRNLVGIVRAERVKRERLKSRLDPILETYLSQIAAG